MVTVLLSLASVVASLLVSPAVAQAPKPPPPPGGQVVIEVVKVHGDGCRPRTAVVALSPDNTAFTVIYSAYTALVGVGATKKDSEKDCQIKVKLDIPKGYTYAVDQVDHRGFAHLERGATGLESASFRFQGSADTPPVNHHFSGPFEDTWQTTDKPDDSALVYAPCGKTHHLDISTALKVSAGTSDPATTTSLMSMDSTDGSVGTKTRYRFTWKRCT